MNSIDDYENILTLTIGSKRGKFYAIDHAYSIVKTPYVFFLEDDFKMIRDVASSQIALLENDPSIVQIWST